MKSTLAYVEYIKYMLAWYVRTIAVNQFIIRLGQSD